VVPSLSAVQVISPFWSRTTVSAPTPIFPTGTFKPIAVPMAVPARASASQVKVMVVASGATTSIAIAAAQGGHSPVGSL
jgi:hypothetical protein